ncbi:hypothetical protein F2P81_015474 [Scophthalmus maximus]|uniref:Uncharacterized protein n=1 Tax=Scophthalmus maximus TaxID=52904 RepID=A0A6A4SQ41_SCOMX|nr:hypothetical protein F2P81_015474 [Scophthalmus maximus]
MTRLLVVEAATPPSRRRLCRLKLPENPESKELQVGVLTEVHNLILPEKRKTLGIKKKLHLCSRNIDSGNSLRSLGTNCRRGSVAFGGLKVSVSPESRRRSARPRHPDTSTLLLQRIKSSTPGNNE